MKNNLVYLIIILSFGFLQSNAQNTLIEGKIKSITAYNIERKTKELDHVTHYSQDGLKSEEIEYFSDGMIKSKTLFEYDNRKDCTKVTKYGPKGKIEKVTVYEYDDSGNKIKESILNVEKHLKSEKIFEYAYH